MTDEYIRQLNSFPQESPDLFLRATRYSGQVASNFDMRAVDDLDIRASLFNQRNEARHLWIINDDDVGTTLRQRSTMGKPISSCVKGDPLRILLLLFKGESSIGGCNTLEDIVIRLCNTEDRRTRLRNKP
jgi:hypothetical protein